MDKPLYHKMKVTGPRSAMLNTYVDPLADVMNPGTTTMRQAVAAMEHAVASGRPKAMAARRRALGPTAALAVYDANLRRLQALKSQFDRSYDPLIRALLRHLRPDPDAPPPADAAAAGAPAVAPAGAPAGAPAAAPAGAAGPPLVPPPGPPQGPPQGPPPGQPIAPQGRPPGPPPGQPAPQAQPHAPRPPPTQATTSKATETQTKHVELVEVGTKLADVLQVLPSLYHRKFAHVNEYIVRNPNVIRPNARGRVVINGKEVANSNYVDIMYALYLFRGKPASQLPIGTRDVLVGLQGLGVPAAALSSAVVKQLYIELGGDDGGSDDFHDAESADQTTKSQSGHGIKWPGRPPKILRLYQV